MTVKWGQRASAYAEGFLQEDWIQSKFFEQTVNIVASNKQSNLLQPLPQEVNSNRVVLA